MADYSVSTLWRYPVKSMAGEELARADVTSAGIYGDRAYALVDRANKRVGSAKSVRKFGELLKWSAQFKTPPKWGGGIPGVRFSGPDGVAIDSESRELASMLAASFGPDIALETIAGDGLMLEFAAGTLGGKHIDTTEVPVAGAAPRGTFFDFAAIHIVTTSTLRHLQKAHDNGGISVQRFRPNLLIDSGSEDGFIEDRWVGRTLAIGTASLRIMMPCPRCVMATLARPDLAADPTLLRLIAQMNMHDLGEIGRLPCAGVYAEVVTAGRVARGDRVRVE